jgi:hypothetical protein
MPFRTLAWVSLFPLIMWKHRKRKNIKAGVLI